LVVATVLRLRELAAALRLPSDWVRDAALAGRIPCLRVGRSLWFDPTAVRAALQRLAAESYATDPAEQAPTSTPRLPLHGTATTARPAVEETNPKH
jgi:hypothetical protein